MIPATRSCRILHERCGKVTGSCRKTPEIAETWKQYSNRVLSRFFPVDSCELPVISGRNGLEIIGKNSKNFRSEYCFHKITGITRSRQFPDRVVRPGREREETRSIHQRIELRSLKRRSDIFKGL